MESDQVQCPDCGEAYTRLLSRWKFCPFCGNRSLGNAETPYSVKDVATLTGWSQATVTRVFKKTPGVIVLSRPETMHKRVHSTLRIPRHVYRRVISSLEVKPGTGRGTK